MVFFFLKVLYIGSPSHQIRFLSGSRRLVIVAYTDLQSVLCLQKTRNELSSSERQCCLVGQFSAQFGGIGLHCGEGNGHGFLIILKMTIYSEKCTKRKQFSPHPRWVTITIPAHPPCSDCWPQRQPQSVCVEHVAGQILVVRYVA